MNAAHAWSGKKLSDNVLAIAVKPAGRGGGELTVAPTGSPSSRVSPSQCSDFISHHAACVLVCADAAELHWALYQHFNDLHDQEALRHLWAFSRDGRLIDLTLLDQLVRLARYTGPCSPLKMADIAKDLAKPQAPPELTDEVQRLSWVHELLVTEAARFGNDLNGALLAPRYVGLLGITIEVQAAIALYPARRQGLRLAPGMLDDIVRSCEEMRDAALGQLSAKTKRSLGLGDQKPLTRNGFPNTGRDKVRKWLNSVHQSQIGIHGFPVAQPLRDNEMSIEPTDWSWQALGNSDLLAWCNLMNACKLRRALLNSPETILPAYEKLPFLRSIGPDLDFAGQLTVPPVFVPATGNRFVVVTLPDLELRSLAAVLQKNYGRSRLWAVLSEGKLPGDELASRLIACRAAPALRTWLSKPEHSHQVATWLLRMVARAVGPSWLRTAAERELGINMDAATGEALHTVMLDAFPELHCYLADDTAARVAGNLGVSLNELNANLRLDVAGRSLSSYLTATKGSEDVRQVYGTLRAFDYNDIFDDMDREPPHYEDLTGRDHWTPTGRLYQRLTPSEALGRDHLHVADAVMKTCLWQATATGYMVVAATKSEMVFEVIAASGHDACEALSTTLTASAQAFLGETAPGCIACCQEQWQPAAG
jgi:hypothetical protein